MQRARRPPPELDQVVDDDGGGEVPRDGRGGGEGREHADEVGEEGAEDEDVDEKELPLLEHLAELRNRILRSLAVTGLIFIPLYYFSNEIYEWLSAPLVAVLPTGSSMIATQVASPFLTPFKLSVYSAIFVGIPYLLHQIWMFVSPGLYRHEKRFAVPLLISSTMLFYGGMLFAYHLVFPLVFSFVTQVAPEGVSIMTDINQYLDFVLKMFLACCQPVTFCSPPRVFWRKTACNLCAHLTSRN